MRDLIEHTVDEDGDFRVYLYCDGDPVEIARGNVLDGQRYAIGVECDSEEVHLLLDNRR